VDDRIELGFVAGRPIVSAGGFAVWSTHDELTGERLAALGLPIGEPARLTVESPPDRAGDDASGSVVDARLLPLLPAVRWLAALAPDEDRPGWQRSSASVTAWSVAAKLALEFAAAGRLVPSLLADPSGGDGRAVWRAATHGDPRPSRLAAAMARLPRVVIGDGAVDPAPAMIRGFLDAVADVCGRGGHRPLVTPRTTSARDTWERMWVAALTGPDPTVTHLRVPAAELALGVDDWAAPLVGGLTDQAVQLLLRVHTPEVDAEEGDAVGSGQERWRMELALRARDSGRTVTADDVWAGRAVTGDAGPVQDPGAVLIRSLAAATRLFPPLERALDRARPTDVSLSADEIALLIDDGIAALEAADVAVALPATLHDLETGRLRLRVRVGGGPEAPRVDGTGALTLRGLAAARLEVTLGQDVISDGELAALVALSAPLVRWRGRWVRVDAEEVDRLRALSGRSLALDLTESLVATLAERHHVDGHGWVEVVADGEVAALVERLRRMPGPEDADVGDFVGELRPYQRRGVAWLQRMGELGLGAVLADQMGLGKTVQAVALLTSRVQERPHLVVAPTSVVGNWERELARFGPDLAVVRHHGPDRAQNPRAFAPGSVVVTSYALLRRDAGLLATVPWDVLILDEAQQIKNPASVGARAARSLDARLRIAMTGTPVENRLSELWAVVDVTTPGLLGTRARFDQRYAVPIERWRDADAAERLRRIVAPFVLRRRKDDEEVALDLPPKSAVLETVGLTREQADLYDAAVAAAFAGAGFGRTAFERQGRILALITALKQICNHPSHYLRDGGPLPGRSAKLDRVTELLGEIAAGDERAIVFTQYREMGDLLVTHLRAELGLPEVPFLHGGSTVAQRDAMIARFQEDPAAPPVLLVSLRAGGTGVNLTRATQVLHYDRWWNPAVEDQATDRAHRIGQQRAVTVHTMMCAGTVEERIADLLERKRDLADAVLAGGEAWLGDLSDDDLRALVSLVRGDGAAEESPEADVDRTAPGGDGPDDAAAAGRPRLRVLPGGAT
jgi:superfamily II DNA or RNA helicase